MMWLFKERRSATPKSAFSQPESDINQRIFAFIHIRLSLFFTMRKLHATHAKIAACGAHRSSLDAGCSQGAQFAGIRTWKPTIGKGYDRWPS
jgi:hypothetical protein